MTVITHPAPLWCQTFAMAWQAFMRTRVMTDEPVQALRWRRPTEQPGYERGRGRAQRSIESDPFRRSGRGMLGRL
jgi:hypothetical protein